VAVQSEIFAHGFDMGDDSENGGMIAWGQVALAGGSAAHTA
jgi:hypothetical protein